jgi:hypothetical protein
MASLLIYVLRHVLTTYSIKPLIHTFSGCLLFSLRFNDSSILPILLYVYHSTQNLKKNMVALIFINVHDVLTTQSRLLFQTHT